MDRGVAGEGIVVQAEGWNEALDSHVMSDNGVLIAFSWEHARRALDMAVAAHGDSLSRLVMKYKDKGQWIVSWGVD